MLSRTIYGTRISVTIGLVGVSLSLFFGILLGGISGYFGGWIDNLIQRLIEFLQSIPSIPLWLGLAAAIPQDVPPLQVYFFITIILSVLGWTGLARVVRGRFYALKTEDFVKAVAWCQNPLIQRELLDIVTRTTDAKILLAALSGIMANEAPTVRRRLNEMINQLPADGPGPYGQGYHLLLALGQRFGTEAKPAFVRYLQNASLQRWRSITHVLGRPAASGPRSFSSRP